MYTQLPLCCSVQTLDLTVGKAIEDGYEDYFDDIGKYLEDKLQGQYTFEDTTNVAIKFSIQPPGQKSIDIDLILSPYFADHHEYLRALKRVQPPPMRLKMLDNINIMIINCGMLVHTPLLFHLCTGSL